MKHSGQRPIPSMLASSLALVTLLTALAAAQRQAHPANPHFNQPTTNFALRQNAHGFRRSPRTSLPFPFFADFFSPDDLYSTGYPVASQPPIILLQSARAPADSSDVTRPNHNHEPAPAPQPLMIELQNGRYGRLTSTPANGEPLPLEPSQAQTRDTKPALTTDVRPHTLPPALLIFRDGHTEEVRDYAIASGILYARGNYYTDGYWTKKIELSALDLSQTLQANTARKVNFVLPTSPNEVITRP